MYDIDRLTALNAPNEVLVILVGSAEYEGVRPHVEIAECESLDSSLERVFACPRRQEIIPRLFDLS